MELWHNLYFLLKSLTFSLSLYDIKFALLFAFIAWYIVSNFNYYKNLPPGPWGVPVLGYLPFINRNAPHSWYLNKAAQYGDIFSVQMGSNLVVCISSAKLMKELFYRPDSTGRPHTPLNDLLGGFGLILSEGSLWKKQRQFLHEKFRELGIKLWPNQRFEKIVLMELQELIDNLNKTQGELVDPSFIIGRHMHNIICQLMMSFRFENNSAEFQMFNERVTRGMQLYGSVHFAEHVKHYLKLPGKQAVIEEIKINLRDISKFHADRFIERERQRKNTSESYEPVDLLDCYLERLEKEKKESELADDIDTIFPDTNPEKQIVQVMNDLFSAGMETSRTALLWCLVMLLRKPDVEQRIRQDLRKYVGVGNTVTLEHRPMLAYIEAVIFETLRTVSLVPLGTTHVNTSAWKINGYTIPAGTHIIPLINKMNADPDIYEDPHKFLPERFLRNNKLHVSETFTQFGVGQRMCLGTQLARMELFLFLANLVNHFEFYLLSTRVPGLEGVLGTTHAPVPFNLWFRKLDNI